MRTLLLLLVMTSIARADIGSTNVPADTILARVRANRPTKDFFLKARLFVTREQSVPLEVLVKNTATETRTIYHAGTNEVLIVQPVSGAPRYFLRGARPTDKLL